MTAIALGRCQDYQQAESMMGYSVNSMWIRSNVLTGLAMTKFWYRV